VAPPPRNKKKTFRGLLVMTPQVIDEIHLIDGRVEFLEEPSDDGGGLVFGVRQDSDVLVKQPVYLRLRMQVLVGGEEVVDVPVGPASLDLGVGGSRATSPRAKKHDRA
jgi:hypothetical protein